MMRLFSRFLALLLSPCLLAQTTRGVTAEDYYQFRNVSDGHLSPDGSQAAFVLTQVNEKRTGRDSAIWLTRTDGSQEPRRFTYSASATHPRWRPDGNALAYLSGGQVYLALMAGGEPRKLTSLANGVSALAWSPDGQRLALVGRSGPSAPESDTRYYRYSSYKYNGRGYFGWLRTHLWVMNVATGEVKQVTSGDQRNDREPVWSPDGTKLAFTAEHTDRQCCSAQAVYTVEAAGGAVTLVAEKFSTAQLPRWSRDGKRVIFVAAVAESMGKVQLPNPPDLTPSEMSLSDDGRTLWFTASAKGEEQIFSWPIAGGALTQITKTPRAVRGVDRHEGAGLMLYTAAGSTAPEDLFVAKLDGTGEKRLTRFNEALWRGLRFPELERVRYRAADGVEIDGFFMKPLDWREGQRYPMVLSIHGGPASMYGVSWFHEFQVYAAKGWAVFFTNPRGSSGYGEKFERMVELEWGGKAYTDILRGVDVALERYPWIDPARLGVTGGSYGGFMTNWIVGHDQRFKAAVTLRGISNFISIEGTRDAAYSHAKDFGGDLYQNYDLYWKYSPIRYAAQVKTPTLVLHSDNDQRVPLEQGEQWFRALQRFGVTSEFVIFPGGDHDLTRTGVPRQLVESLNWQVYWFDRFLNGNASAAPPVQAK
ncbi:MAG: S9 family peptidase [Bryobacteraceae bacterium]|nr:S9 family peptidase [Bryobacteraceae bacterium]